MFDGSEFTLVAGKAAKTPSERCRGTLEQHTKPPNAQSTCLEQPTYPQSPLPRHKRVQARVLICLFCFPL